MSEEFFRNLSPSTGSSPAEAGQKMLQRFREQRSKSKSDTPSGAASAVKDVNSPSYFEAIADGSHIASVFSEKKGRDRSAPRSRGLGKKLFQDPIDSENTASSLREAMSILQESSGKPITQDKVDQLTALLGHAIETTNANEGSQSGLFRNFGTPSNKYSDAGSIEDSIINTPNTDVFASGGSALRSVRKDYMDSLDQDAENLQLYEDAIVELKAERDALAEDVSRLEQERNDLSDVCSSLGERLKSIGLDYDEKLNRLSLEKEEVRVKHQELIDSLIAAQRIADQNQRSLEQQVLHLTEEKNFEGTQRRLAENERELMSQKYSSLLENNHLMDENTANTEKQLQSLRAREIQLKDQVEMLEKNLTTERKHRQEDFEQLKVVGLLEVKVKQQAEEIEAKNSLVKLLESRVESAENLNSQYSLQLGELSRSIDELTTANIALESKNEASQIKIIELQREMLEFTRNKSASTTPSRTKKGSNGKAAAADSVHEKDKALLEAQLLIQHYVQELEEKDKIIAKAAEVSNLNAIEVENLLEANRKYEEIIRSQTIQSINPSQLNGDEEYIAQLESELAGSKDTNKALELEIRSLKADKSLRSPIRNASAAPPLPPIQSPASANIQDLLFASGHSTPEASPKPNSRNQLDFQQELERVSEELDRTQNCLIESDDEKKELKDKLTALEGAYHDAVKEKELLVQRSNAKLEEIMKLKDDVERLQKQFKHAKEETQPLRELISMLEVRVQEGELREAELKETIDHLEGQIAIFGKIVEDKDNELADERAISDNLRSCLDTKFDEDTHSDERLRMANETIIARDSLLAMLRKEYDEHAERSERREQELLAELNAKNAELDIAEKKLLAVTGDVQTTVLDLRTRLDHIGLEKQDIQQSLQIHKDKCLKLEFELRDKSTELQTVLKDFSRVVETVQFYKNRLDAQAETLTKQTEMWFNSFDSRVQSVASVIRNKQMNVRAIRKEFERKMEDTLNSLNQVMDSNDGLLAERNYFEEKLRESLTEREELERALDDLRLENQVQQQDMSRESAQLASEEYARLAERLELAERRAVEMSTNGAKAFAKSARTIAYLEGECGHNASLVDHFRGVNAKLANDLKIANEEALRAKGLEHRLNMACENEVQLLGRITSLENVIRSKEKELLLTLHSSQNQEEIRTEKFDAEIRELTDKLKASKDKIQSLTREIKSSSDNYEARIASLLEDISFGKEQIKFVEQERDRLQSKLAEVDATNSTLRASVRSFEDRAIELEGHIQLLTQDKVMFGDAFEKRKIEFDTSVQEKVRRIRELEGQLTSLKKQLSDVESSNLLKDDVISSALNKQSTLTEESRALRSKVDSLSGENQSLSQTNEELRLQLSHTSHELLSIKNSYGELKGAVHPETVSKLQHAEDLLRSQSLELELLKEDYAKVKSEFSSLVEKLSQSDRRNHELQSSLAISEGEAQAAQSHNNSLLEENSKLRTQTEELAVRVTNFTRDLSSARVLLQEKENEIELYSTKLRDSEEALTLAKEKNSYFEAFETDIANEMRDFGDEISASATATTIAREVSEVSSYLEAEFFSSPLPTSSRQRNHSLQMVAKSSSPKDDNRNFPATPSGLTQHSLSLVRQGFDELKAKSEGLVQQNQRLKEQLALAKKEFVESRKRLEHAELELRSSSVEAERLISQLESAEDQLAECRREISKATDERSQIYANADEFAQSIRSQIRNMDTAVSDSIARVHALVAGRVIVGPDDVPILLSFQPTSPPAKHLVKSSQSRSSAVDFGAASMLSTSVHEAERALQFMCSSLEAILIDSTMKKQSADRVDLLLIDKERSWGKERTGFYDRIAALESEVESETNLKNSAEEECNNLSKQLESCKILLNEFSRQKDELETECRASMANAETLQSALSEAEAVCLDLRSKLRNSQADNESKLDELSSLSNQLNLLRKRLAEADLSIEKLTTSHARIKSEKDAMDGVRKSLEAELDRSRMEVNSLKTQVRSIEDEGKSSFEIEKLLAALGSTLDQVQAAFSTSASSSVVANKGTSNAAPATGKEEDSLSLRVDAAVKRLGELRSWARDECRSRRALEETLQTMEQDLQSSTSTNESLQEQMKKVMQSVSEKSQESREKSKEISELQNTVLRRQEEIDKVRRELHNKEAAFDDEKRNRLKLIADVQSKDSELSRLRLELENTNASLSRTTELLNSAKDRVNELTIEADQRNEQLRLAKANNTRLSSSLEALERGVDRDRSDRGILEQKLLDNESHAVVSMRLRSQVADLESSLHATRDNLKQVSESRDIAEQQLHSCHVELEAVKSSLRSAESRLEQSQRERISLQEECHSNRLAVTRLNQQLEQEQTSRLRAETNLDALKRSNTNVRSVDQDYAAIMGDVEDRIISNEQEHNHLIQENHQLRLAVEEKEAQRVSEESKAVKLEREIQLLKSKLNMTSQEIAASNNRAAALRTEGRRARSQVLEAVSQMWEVVDVVRADARSVGIDMHTPMKARESKTNSAEESTTVLGLEEALAVPELVDALSSFKACVDFIRDVPRSRLELETAIKRIEQDKIRMQKELTNTESRCEERLTRLREEIQTLQTQLSDYRKAESNRNAGTKQVSSLEMMLRQERDDKEKALGLVSKLKDECDLLTKDLHAVKKELAAQRAHALQTASHGDSGLHKAEAEIAREELNSTRKELQAVNHHRNVLRETVDQLEKQLRSKVDALSDLQYALELEDPTKKDLFIHLQTGHEDSPGSIRNRSRINHADDEEHLKKQIVRFRARSQAMEELVAVYRTGLLALYADGASYGAAQHGWQQGDSADGLGVGWIEKEMASVKKSYDEEIKLLDSEINELRGKLRQSVSYITELRKRFEENMKTFYRTNRSQGSDGLLLQYEQVSLSLEKAELEIQELTHELAHERQEGRRRHAVLVDDLVKALQARDAALSAVKRLELSCIDAGIQHVSIYETLKAEVNPLTPLKAHEVSMFRHSRMDSDLNINSDRRSVGHNSHRKKDKVEKLREKEREYEREKDEIQREFQAHYDHLALTSGSTTKATSALASRHPLSASSHTASALNQSGIYSVGSKMSSPSNQPFVVRHVSAPDSNQPQVKQSSPPLTQRASAGTSGSNPNSRHSSPSGVSSQLYSSVATSIMSNANTSFNTNQAVTGGPTTTAPRSRLPATSVANVRPAPVRHPSPGSSRPSTTNLSMTAPPSWQVNIPDGAHLISHRGRGEAPTSTARSASRGKY